MNASPYLYVSWYGAALTTDILTISADVLPSLSI